MDNVAIAIAVLAFVAIGGVGFALASTQNEQAAKRAKRVTSGDDASRGRGHPKNDENAQRRKDTQQMLAKLRQENQQKRRSLVPQDMNAKIAQAGLSISVSAFWIISAVVGVGAAVAVYLSGADGVTLFGIPLKSRVGVIAAAGIAGFIGLPRWTLGFLAKGRNKKITAQFADAIDIIVRGVKSGLPLNECLQMIARESPNPLGAEFERLTDSIVMGSTLESALQKFYARVPLSEINFFIIVLTIQAKAGGNLSEALQNLSDVIRSRRMMREKVSALSSEAKASAMIIGCLPFAVGLMVFITTPDYIMLLFTTESGHGILATGAVLMGIGITVMRKMINFDM